MTVVIINPSYGGSQTGVTKNNLIEKNVNLNIAKNIYNILINNNIEAYLTRNNDINLTILERINIINELQKNNTNLVIITITLRNNNEADIEIIYPLRSDDELVLQIVNSLNEDGFDTSKYYQLRDPNDTSKDYYQIIRDTNTPNNIIIDLGNINNINDYNKILNNQNELSKSIADGIMNYIKKENIYIVKSGDKIFMGNNE